MAVTTNNFKNGMCIMLRRQDVDHRRVPAREARQGRRVRPHEAQGAQDRPRGRHHVPRGREARRRAHRDQAHAVPLQRRRRRSTSWTPTRYEQFELGGDFVGDTAKWLKENDEVADHDRRRRDDRRRAADVRRARGHRDRSRASRATPSRAARSPRRSRPARSCRSRCSSTPGDKLKIDTRDGRYITRV